MVKLILKSLTLAGLFSSTAFAQFTGVGIELTDDGRYYIVFESTLKRGDSVIKDDNGAVYEIRRIDPDQDYNETMSLDRVGISIRDAAGVAGPGEDITIQIGLNTEVDAELSVLTNNSRRRIIQKLDVTNLVSTAEAERNGAYFKFDIYTNNNWVEHRFYPSLVTPGVPLTVTGELVSLQNTVPIDAHKAKARQDWVDSLKNNYGLNDGAASMVVDKLSAGKGWSTLDALGFDLPGGRTPSREQVIARVATLNQKFSTAMSCAGIL